MNLWAMFLHLIAITLAKSAKAVSEKASQIDEKIKWRIL